MELQFEYERSKQGLADAFNMGMRDEYAGNNAKTGKRICYLVEQRRALGYCIGLVERDFKSAYMSGRRFYNAMREAGLSGQTLDRIGAA